MPLKHVAHLLRSGARSFARLPRPCTCFIVLGVVATLIPGPVRAQTTNANASAHASGTQQSGVLADIKQYVTAPLHWDGRNWAFFGGALVAVGAAHHYDSDVRNHFTADESSALGTDSKDLQDAIPAAAAFAGTWIYASVIDDNDGRKEAWAMLEAAGLSSATSFVLKYATGRERPDETSDPDRWREGGDSFPSLHTTAAFAIGTVLAESGNDKYRWTRRCLGYGVVAGFTAYERLDHNAHWLSDTVAGAALGTASAHFVMNRANGSERGTALSLVPVEGGVMLTYSATLR